MTITKQTQTDLAKIIEQYDQRIYELGSDPAAGAEVVSLVALRADAAALMGAR